MVWVETFGEAGGKRDLVLLNVIVRGLSPVCHMYIPKVVVHLVMGSSRVYFAVVEKQHGLVWHGFIT